MRGKFLAILVIGCLISFGIGILGYSLLSQEKGPIGDSVVVSLEKGAAGLELQVDKPIAYADREADIRWTRKEGQNFSFVVFLPKESPFAADLGNKLKSKDQAETTPWHGIKAKVDKGAEAKIYHYIIGAIYEGEVYILDPDIIIPRPGKG